MARKKIYFIILALFLPASLDAASIKVVVPESFYPSSSLLVAEILIDSQDQSINAASLQLMFPPDKLSVVSIQTEESIFNTWPQKPIFSNEMGTIGMEGVKIGGDWSGKNGKMAEIIFKVKAAGEAKINITSSAVLANDGEGTNVLDSIRHAAIGLGVGENTKYLIVGAEEVAAQEEVTTENDTSSLAIESFAENNNSFWGRQINVAYTILVTLLLVVVFLWQFLVKQKPAGNDVVSLHKEVAKIVRSLEEKRDKEGLTEEEEKILKNLTDRIVSDYEKNTT